MTHHQPAGHRRPDPKRVGVVLVMGMRAKGAASSWRLLGPVAVAGVLLVVSCTAPGTGDGPNDPGRGADAPPSSPVSTSDAPTAADDLLAEALRDMDLPEGPIPEGFIEADRLYGECIASFGFPVSDPNSPGGRVSTSSTSVTRRSSSNVSRRWGPPADEPCESSEW